MAASDVYRELGEAAWSWALKQVREDEGPWLPESTERLGGGPSRPVVGRPRVVALYGLR
ncbi:hypothetical protein [Streptomyces sp. NPDC046805]|uniref:hypothetical protein n=1 Tax=Streptomyces sp. NPDC046805 TaxID=3155134 RepID=UPI0034075F33